MSESSFLGDLWLLIKRTVQDTVNKDVSLMAAGLSFFALISLAPFLVIAIAIGGAVFGRDIAHDELMQRLTDEFGPKVAEFFLQTIEGAGDLQSISMATVISAAVLFWGALRLFAEVRSALNLLWDVPVKNSENWRFAVWSYVRGKLLAACSVIIFGMMFLVLLGSRVALNFIDELVARLDLFEMPTWAWNFAEGGIALLLVAAIIVVIYKLLPDKKPTGVHLWIGALVTAVLLLVGRFLVALYLATGTLDSVYGAAGSIIVFLIWAYYSSMAFLFGARLTYLIDTGQYRDDAEPAA